MANKRKAHRRFDGARKAADARLINRISGVVGTCIGLRETDGQRLNEPCLTVFVRKKRPKAKLSTTSVIAPKVVRHGREWQTDVVEIRGIEKQGCFGIQDGAHAGTLGCFGRNSAGWFGVTCAHCIGGPDNDPSTPNDIVVEYPQVGNFTLLGTSAGAVDIPGTGIYPDYGAIDSGSVALRDASIQNYATAQPILSELRFDATLPSDEIANNLSFTPVSGTGAKSGYHDAIVAGVFCHVFGEFFDLMITTATNGPLTERGDSGLVWLDPFGRAVGFHMQGDTTPGGGPSTRAFAVFAFRVADGLGVTFSSV
jgi:hypothetical protein